MAKNKPKPRSDGSSKPKSSTRPTVARPGANTLEGKAQPYLKRVENLLTDLDSKRGAYMAECKVVREDIKEIYGEAKDHGISVKALKALVEYRVLEKKQAKLAEDFDIEEQAVYSQLVSALGPARLRGGAARRLSAGERERGRGARRAPAPHDAAGRQRRHHHRERQRRSCAACRRSRACASRPRSRGRAGRACRRGQHRAAARHPLRCTACCAVASVRWSRGRATAAQPVRCCP